MIIGKPIRHLAPIIAAGSIAIALSALHKTPWIIILATLLGYGISDWSINTFDFWLRKRTKDQLWLWGHEGKEWLKTDEGQKWKRETEYRK